MKRAVISLSGGMDSSSLLIHLLAAGYEVKAINFDYGQKHVIETERAAALWRYLVDQGVIKNHWDFHVLKLPLQDLVQSNLMKGGDDVPEGHYEDENMKATVVPNRNKIFASLIQAAALSWSNEQKQGEKEVAIAMGIHAGDHAIYPDCRKEFRDADYNAFLEGNWGGANVEYLTPYLEIDKEGILEDAFDSCEKLGLNFNEVFERTMTSYKPIFIPSDDKGNGDWYADYKSASSVERIEAFINIGIDDPCEYADESGPVSWEFAADYVTEVLRDNRQSK